MKRILSCLLLLVFSLTVSMPVFAETTDAPRQSDGTNIAVVIVGAVLLPFIIAFIMMSVQLAKMNTAVADDYASNYEKSGSYHLDMANDIFLYSRITKVKKANNHSVSSSRRFP